MYFGGVLSVNRYLISAMLIACWFLRKRLFLISRCRYGSVQVVVLELKFEQGTGLPPGVGFFRSGVEGEIVELNSM